MLKNEEDTLLLLKIIEKEGNLINLIDRGYSYQELSKIMQWTILNKYAIMSEGRLEITSVGQQKLLTLIKEVGDSNKNRIWISKKVERQIPKIGIYDIYVKKN